MRNIITTLLSLVANAANRALSAIWNIFKSIFNTILLGLDLQSIP